MCWGAPPHFGRPSLDPAQASPDPLSPTPAQSTIASPLRPAPLLKSPPRGDYAVMPWELLAINGDRRLVIRYLPAATIRKLSTVTCTTPLGVLVETTPSWVLVAPLAAVPSGSQLCPAIARYPVVRYIDLATPLGARRLLHPPVGPGVAEQLQNRLPRPNLPGSKATMRPSPTPGQG